MTETESGKIEIKIKADGYADLMNFNKYIDFGATYLGGGIGVIQAYISMMLGSGSKSDYTYYLNQNADQFERLRAATVFFAQSSAELKAIRERTQGITDEMAEAIALVEEKFNHTDAGKAMLADMQVWIASVEQYKGDIISACNRYLGTPDQPVSNEHFLNQESKSYFMSNILESINKTFNIDFQEGGTHYEYYKEGGKYYRDYAKEENVPDVDLRKIQKDLKAACPLFTEEYIWAQVAGSEETEEEEQGSGFVNNNRIVVVTYGDRDSETFEKTPFKSIILNYNSYAVRVTYNGTLYTVPSGGYVVINYND